MGTILNKIIVMLLCVVVVAGCAGQGWRIKWGAPPEGDTVAKVDEGVVEDLEGDAEAQLRRLVAREVRGEERRGSADSPDVVHMRPYFIREYVTYPGGADAMEVELQETDSRTAPLKAEVALEKIRYATRLHREKQAALADDNFIRSTGIEVITYEYRMGRWRRLGSTFVADRTEELVGGTWVNVRDDAGLPDAPQPKRGWFKRTFGFVTGG